MEQHFFTSELLLIVQVLDDDNDSTLFHSFKKVEYRAEKHSRGSEEEAWKQQMFHEKGSGSQLVLLLEVTHRTTTLNDNTAAVCLQGNTSRSYFTVQELHTTRQVLGVFMHMSYYCCY